MGKAAGKGRQDQRGACAQPFHGCISHFLSSARLRKQERQPEKGVRIKGACAALKFSILGVRKGGASSYILDRLVNRKIQYVFIVFALLNQVVGDL